MIKSISKISFLCSLIVCLFIYSSSLVFAQSEILNPQNNTAKAKVGTKALTISLRDLNGNLVDIFKEKRVTVVVHLNHYQKEFDVLQYDKLYKKWKTKAALYIVADSKNKDIKDIFDVNKMSVPILLEKDGEYTSQYNNNASLLIVDKERTIKYNNTFHISLKELDRYIKQIVQEKTIESPQFSATLLNKYIKSAVPPLLLEGQKAGSEKFTTVKYEDYRLKFKDKPTVLLFWQSFSDKNLVKERMDMMQAAYKKVGYTIRFFSIACSMDNETLHDRLKGWKYSIPVLRLDKGRYLRYVREFPSFIFIDRKGRVHRYEQDTKEVFLQAIDQLDEI